MVPKITNPTNAPYTMDELRDVGISTPKADTNTNIGKMNLYHETLC